DFGVAKLLDPLGLGEKDEQTFGLLRLMTPEYSSPEQLRGFPVTTSTDVFSLGVVLYELLSGHRPFSFQNRSPDEIVRVLLTEEPPRPSSVVTKTVEARDTINESNKLTPEFIGSTREGHVDRLRRRLLGDLDNIVLK